MQQDSTNNQPSNNRRDFIRKAGMTGAALAGIPLIGTLANAQPVATLEPAALSVAVDLLTEIRKSQRSGLLLLIVEHVAAVAATGTARDVEAALDIIRGVVINGDAKACTCSLEALRSETRETLTRAVALDAADSNN